MTNKKIVKLAVIRTEKDMSCPFGLNIPNGCKNAGELVTQMAPINILVDSSEKEKAAIKKANRRLYMWHAPGDRCYYAGKIFKGKSEKGAVECNFGSNAPGISEKGLLGAPFYSKVYNNVGLDGLNSSPLGYFSDHNISRNIYYGIYSLMGSEELKEEIIKVAEDEEDL